MTDLKTDSVTECVQMAYTTGNVADYDAVRGAKPSLDVYGKPIKPRPPYATLDGLPVAVYNRMHPLESVFKDDKDYDDS